MTGVYIGLGLAALFMLGLVAYIAKTWKSWTSKQRKYAIAGMAGCIAIVSAIIVVGSNVSMTFARPSELLKKISSGEIKLGEQVKVEGEIIGDTIKTTDYGNTTEFEIKDKKSKIKIIFTGTRPDNFKDGIQAVAVGTYDGRVFKTDDVKTKCPSKYQAKEKKKET